MRRSRPYRSTQWHISTALSTILAVRHLLSAFILLSVASNTLNWLFKQRLLSSFLILLSALVLNGCDRVDDVINIDDFLDQDKPSQTNDGAPFCTQMDEPFSYDLCSVEQDLLGNNADKKLQLKLFWRPKMLGAVDEPLYRFEALKEDLPNSDSLVFAVNAGMYNSEFSPIGYTVMQGEEIRSLNLKEGGGNFHLLPNGVLWWDKDGHVSVTESHTLSQMLDNNEAAPWFATQSGPMLVINNEIHPKFNADSVSFKFRNGVGVCDDGEVRFVNSNEPVNFYQFASLFKDTLGCPNALFLDGGIASAMYAPEIDVSDGQNMGVMVGLIEHD